MTNADLILRDDGSVYHLGIGPDDISNRIITVGDPDRVPHVSNYFDRIDTIKKSREFAIHTGELSGQRLTVLSTGIGTSNIDIVLHELDYAVNVDLSTRQIKENHTQLDLIRLGTSGALREDIDCGTLLVSESAFGADGLARYYPSIVKLPESFDGLAQSDIWDDYCYWTEMSASLATELNIEAFQGRTYTAQGFYAPQFRNTRVQSLLDRQQELASYGITNIEMETAGIYLLASHLGHRAISFNAILANRATGVFIDDAAGAVDDMIKNVLEALTSN